MSELESEGKERGSQTHWREGRMKKRETALENQPRKERELKNSEWFRSRERRDRETEREARASVPLTWAKGFAVQLL